MAKNIDSLIGSARWKSGTSVARRVSPRVLKHIESDFRKVIDAEQAGKPIPSISRLVDYLMDTYGLAISRTSVSGWLNNVRRGLPIR